MISVTADFPETIDGIDDIVVPKKTGDVKFAYTPGQFRMRLSLPDILVEASEALKFRRRLTLQKQLIARFPQKQTLSPSMNQEAP